MNVTEMVCRQTDRDPDAVAIIDRHGDVDRSTSYVRFDRSVSSVAMQLRHSGLRPGDTVLILHPMSTELYVALAAVLRSGMTAMFVDPSAGRRSIDRCCELVPPRGMIGSGKAHLLRLISPAIRRIPIQCVIGNPIPFTRRIDPWTGVAGDGTIHSCQHTTPALISFTSGSTGLPKAVVRTHGFLQAQHHAVEKHMLLVAGQVELVTMPIFVMANLASRVTSVIADADLRQVGQVCGGPIIRQIQRLVIDRMTAAPAFMTRIVEACESEQIQLDSLRWIFTGGGPVHPRLLERLRTVAPHAEMVAVYGSTEAEPICTVTGEETLACRTDAQCVEHGLLAGQPVDSLQVRIIADQWGQTIGPLTASQFSQRILPTGVAGEIVVSGDHVLDGFLQRESDVENKFSVDRQRWHRTGDAGYFDDQGRLWLQGRCAARIDDSKGQIYPLVVEQAAMQAGDVGLAALISIDNQRVLAITASDPMRTPDLERLKDSIAFASVDSVRLLKQIPVDARHQSKIDYPKLRQLLARHR